MFHDDGTTAFAPSDGTGQAACDHFLDICERKMGLSTCLKLEKFTMGPSNLKLLHISHTTPRFSSRRRELEGAQRDAHVRRIVWNGVERGRGTHDLRPDKGGGEL